jgi:hypothetical protein
MGIARDKETRTKRTNAFMVKKKGEIDLDEDPETA